MFSYYGSKSKVAKLYPAPEYEHIIEPFAGSARYSLLHWEKQVTLIDKNETVVALWHYLQLCSESDILGLPDVKVGDDLRSFKLIEEEYQLLRFLLQQGTPGGSKAYEWGVRRYKGNLNRIAKSLYKIRHWRIKVGNFNDEPNSEATWFVDPPYSVGGHKYKHSNKNIDFSALGEWCLSRRGQIIVCENGNANWLPFQHLSDIKGIRKRSSEVMFTNDPMNDSCF